MNDSKDNNKLRIHAGVGLLVFGAALLLGGCGTWETSSSVNWYGRIKHDTATDDRDYPLTPYSEEIEILRNP